MKIALFCLLGILLVYLLIKGYKMYRTYRNLKKIFKNNFNQDLMKVVDKLNKKV